MSLLEKLNSFDADIRYMGLSDLQKAIATQPPAASWPEAVVGLLADTSLEVQNLAIHVTGELAAVGTHGLAELLLTAAAPPTVRAVALKAVIHHARPLHRNSVLAVLSAVPSDPLFQTVEGAEAVVELLSLPTSRYWLKTSRGVVFAYATQIAAHPGLLRMRGFDILALTLPSFSETEWQESAHTFVLDSVATSHEPAAIALVGKLAHKVPSSWLIPEFEDVLIRQADALDDLDVCEAAIDSLAALYGLPNFDTARANKLSKRLVMYREFEDASDNSLSAENVGSDDIWDDEIMSDGSAVFDETSRVRKAAAKLAMQSDLPEIISEVIASVKREEDESTRAFMYMMLAGHLGSSAAANLSQLSPCVLKDISAGNWIAAEAGISAIAAGKVQTSTALVLRAAVERRPRLLHQYIRSLQSPRNEDTEWLLSRALQQDIAVVPETSIAALKLVGDMNLTSCFKDAAELVWPTFAEPLRIAALRVVGKLASGDDLKHVVPLAVECMRTDPTMRPAALDCLEAAELSLETVQAREVANTIYGIVDGPASPGLIARYCAVLEKMPSEVAPETVRAVLRLGDADCKDQKEAILKSTARAVQPGVQEWALASEALGLLRFLAQSGDKSLLDRALVESKTAEVHAAAAGRHWMALDSRYRFSSSPFADLNEGQLRVLLALAQNETVWDWYSLSDMMSAAVNSSASLRGSIIGNMAVNLHDESQFLDAASTLCESVRESAFAAYAVRTENKSAVFEVASKFEQLRIPGALAAAVESQDALMSFLKVFGVGDHAADGAIDAQIASVVVATIKLLQGDTLVGSLPTLIALAGNHELDSETRGEACMTAAWLLQTVEETRTTANVEQALNTFATALKPIGDQVQTINIGPFKHRVDRNLPLRRAAIDGIYTCASLMPLAHYHRIVDAVVDYALRDEFEVKVVACRAVSVLAAMHAETVQARQHSIEEHFEVEISRKLKENATKEDVEKHAALVTVIQQTRQKLAMYT